jgi:hypothetical protein
MTSQIDLLREQLARLLHGCSHDDPRIEHLRWQIASLERQAHWRRESAGMFGGHAGGLGLTSRRRHLIR